MHRIKIKDITPDQIGKSLTVGGWVRSVRDQKKFAFIELNDGSSLKSLQVIAEEMAEIVETLTTGCSLLIEGTLVESPGDKQPFELKAGKITVLGGSPVEEYPLQKKRHSLEFLRTIAHLRPRTNLQGAVLRVRSELSFATHEFFHSKGFHYIHTPIITASDTEGAGELFLVSSGKEDFFGKPAYLTVSGQLNAEAVACALSDVYTFGPTFRAENSHTTRHLAEFWMVEPEMAFCDLEADMKNAEAFIKTATQAILEKCPDEMTLFDNFVEKGLKQRLEKVVSLPFDHLTYTQAIDVLKQSGQSFEYAPEWGIDLQTEHERYLAEVHCKKPVFITDYPKTIKAFYMRDNDDGKTVAAFDLLVPKLGELIGGSQREERQDVLIKKMGENDLNPEDYWWYLELRKFGTVPHAGYGVGFERLIQFITGVENIRDVIPFPRYAGNASF